MSVLGHKQEPCHAECSSVRGIDDGVQEVEPGKSEAVERCLFSDVREQKHGDSEGGQGVNVHGKLDRR